MEIVSTPYTKLSPEQRRQLESLAQAEFGGFSLVRETAWAVPDWSFQGYVDDTLACFYNLVLRQAWFDGNPVPLAGLNNLITVPTFRGRGLGSQLLATTQSDWFDRFATRYGLLLCADNLLSFYTKLGWRRVVSEVWFEQPSGPQAWKANCMVLTNDDDEVAPMKIDLGGFPW